MATTPTNVLQIVQTYQKAELAWLLNSFVGISLTNKKFKDFNTTAPSNLGDTVTFDTTPRFISFGGLVITQQPSVQRVQSLICSQSANVAMGYTDQQFIFNVREYMDRFGMAAMKELGTLVEADILKNFVSGVTVNDPQSPNQGIKQFKSGPFRFYGDGITPINSFTQLAQSVANFEDFGAANHKMCAILPVANIPAIVGSGLNQFATDRNNELATSWTLGKFAGADWYESNLLPVHVSGAIAEAAAPNNVMEVKSFVNLNSSTVEITFNTGLLNTPLAVRAGDLVQFNDGVAGKPNLRFLTFIGHEVCQQPVQFRVIEDAATDGAGDVVVKFQTINDVGLVWNPTSQNRNLNVALEVGMKATPVPSHRAGILMSGDQFYMAMPRLPDESPFTTVTTVDSDSGASIRHYFGSQFGLNNRAYVRDCLWGSTLVAENSLRYAFPL